MLVVANNHVGRRISPVMAPFLYTTQAERFSGLFRIASK